MNVHVTNLQFAIFFKGIVDRPDLEFSKLNDQLLNLFDTIPLTNPVPRELPNDIPIVTLRSEDEKYSCNIARSRIDLYFNARDKELSNTDILKDFNLKVKAFSEYVISEQDITRFGMVCTYFIEDNTATHTLKKKYFSGAINDPEELSLRFNNIAKCENIELNDIVDISKKTLSFKGGKPIKGIVIQRDINNRSVNEVLSMKDLNKISKHFSSKISEAGVEALIK